MDALREDFEKYSPFLAERYQFDTLCSKVNITNNRSNNLQESEEALEFINRFMNGPFVEKFELLTL